MRAIKNALSPEGMNPRKTCPGVLRFSLEVVGSAFRPACDGQDRVRREPERKYLNHYCNNLLKLC